MKAEVFYVRLTNEQRDEINDPNSGGWSSEIGKRYLAAKDGNVDDNMMFEHAATVDFRFNEEVWMHLQNHAAPWSENSEIEVHTNFPRSMDVGDYVVWDSGEAYRVADRGFDKIERPTE